MSGSSNPASRRRFAIASAALVTLPAESVVLISISCLKISCARRWYSCGADLAGSFADSDGAENHASERAATTVPVRIGLTGILPLAAIYLETTQAWLATGTANAR